MTKLYAYGFSFLAILTAAFILDEAAISSLRNSTVPFRDIGKSVSWMGDGKWSGSVLLICSFILALVAKNASDPVIRRHAKLFLTAAVMLFIAGLLSGVAVQLIKHGIGRARPTLFEELGAYNFEPFAFNTKQNSFPSGHSSTIGALTMTGALLLPKYRWLFLAWALIVGVGRIMDGAHYVSDVVAGLTLGASVSFLLLKRLVARHVLPAPNHRKWAAASRCFLRIALKNIPIKDNKVENDIQRLNLIIAVLVISIFSMVIFINRPEIDIAVAGLFFSEESGFWLDHDLVLARLRTVYMYSIYLTLIASCCFWYVGIRCRDAIRINPEIWGFVSTAIFVGPGLVSNSLLKTHWGRARPAQINEFGGSSQYTHALEIADECSRNCSFVSGEGSGIAMLFFIFVALGWPTMRKAPLAWLLPLCTVAVFGIAMRIMKGRHFVSDSVFAILLMALVVLILYRVFEIRKHRNDLTWTALFDDVKVGISYSISPYATKCSLLRDVSRTLSAVVFACAVTGEILKTFLLNSTYTSDYLKSR